MFIKPPYQPHPLQNTDTSYNRSRMQLTPSSFIQKQQVANIRRDSTPTKQAHQSFQQQRSESKLIRDYGKSAQKLQELSGAPKVVVQYPVAQQHIRLNQIEDNYQTNYSKNTTFVQSIDATPQRYAPKFYNDLSHVISQEFPQKCLQKMQLNHNSSDSNRNTKVRVNLNLQQFQQPQSYLTKNTPNPLKEKENLVKVPGKSQQDDQSQQIFDLKKQKESICQALSESYRKSQLLVQQMENMQKEKEQASQEYEHNLTQCQSEIEDLQDRLQEMSGINENLSKEYEIRLIQMESQMKQNRMGDQKRIQDLEKELEDQKLIIESLGQEVNDLQHSRNELLEMNESLESELRQLGEQNGDFQQQNNELQMQCNHLEQQLSECKKSGNAKKGGVELDRLRKEEQQLGLALLEQDRGIQDCSEVCNPQDLQELCHKQQVEQLSRLIDGLELENMILINRLHQKSLN